MARDNHLIRNRNKYNKIDILLNAAKYYHFKRPSPLSE